MKGGTLTTIVLAAGLAAVTLPAAPASADTETVETPAGTFYVEEDHEAHGPTMGDEQICFGTICTVVFPFPDDPGGAHVRGAVWQEANGCEGLQRETGDCDGDGDLEDPDERLVEIDEGV